MIFTSYTFLLFSFIFILSYRILRIDKRIILIGFGLIFYLISDLQNIHWVILTFLYAYWVAKKIINSEIITLKFKYLLLGVIGLVIQLIIFKYFIVVDIPFGLSFYTFILIGGLTEIYFNNKLNVSWLDLINMTLFFPTISSGPILRLKDFTSQFTQVNKNEKSFNIEGLKRFLRGMFIKVVIVSSLSSIYVEVWKIEPVYLSAIDVWTIAFLSGLLIYLDFSSYSHMAIGFCQLVGIKIPENFSFPYISKNPQEFWSKWHMSLSSWLFENIFQNVQLKLREFFKNNKNIPNIIGLFTTFIICGLWHGNTLNFVLWGIYHAMLILIYQFNKTYLNKKVHAFILWVFTLLLVMYGWLLFSTNETYKIIEFSLKIVNPFLYTKLGLRENIYLLVFLVFCGVMFTNYIQKMISKYSEKYLLLYKLLENGFYFIIISLILLYFSTSEKFIYTQF